MIYNNRKEMENKNKNRIEDNTYLEDRLVNNTPYDNLLFKSDSMIQYFSYRDVKNGELDCTEAMFSFERYRYRYNLSFKRAFKNVLEIRDYLRDDKKMESVLEKYFKMNIYTID